MSAAQSQGTPLVPESSAPSRLVLESDLSSAARNRLARADIAEAARLWRLAFTLGWFDIRLRYRGSMLGPLWLTLSTAIMVGALGFLYSQLFKMELREYLPFLAISMVLWGFLSTVIGEACVCFTTAEGLIRSMRIPHSVHAIRVIVRNLLVLVHNVAVIFVVYAIFEIWPGLPILWAVPALALWIVDGFAICLLLGPIGARFRDIPPIVGSIVQLVFFISPILWKPELLQGRAAELLYLNPIYTLLEIVRAPMLGEAASPVVWFSALGFSVVLWIAGWFLFARVRGRLTFWV
ncbi:MAG TPA: ABC transporter permease [Acetobacteraceae bacterium]|nr:ABC transporter permease [Acetobacteraceae bacterium]